MLLGGRSEPEHGNTAHTGIYGNIRYLLICAPIQDWSVVYCAVLYFITAVLEGILEQFRIMFHLKIAACLVKIIRVQCCDFARSHDTRLL